MRKQFLHIKFTYRLRPEMHKALSKSAKRNGRSLAEEITMRLEHSLLWSKGKS